MHAATLVSAAPAAEEMPVGQTPAHVFVVEPVAEKVPAAQSTTTALAVVEHCVVMRLPAEVTAHVLGHAVDTSVPYVEVVLVAEYLPDAHVVHVRSAVVVAGAE